METRATHELRPKKQMTIYTSTHLYIYLYTSPSLIYEISTSNSEGQEKTKKQLTTQDYQPLQGAIERIHCTQTARKLFTNNMNNRNKLTHNTKSTRRIMFCQHWWFHFFTVPQSIIYRMPMWNTSPAKILGRVVNTSASFSGGSVLKTLSE